MNPGSAPGAGGSDPSELPPPDPSWTPGVPSVREHLPSIIFGAAVPIAVYFSVRSHVNTDAQALIVAGCFSAGWILFQFARQRRLDFVGAIVLFGFAVGVVSSTVLGGNSYVLKVRDAFFTAIFGIACIVTIYTHDRPALFYVSRYLSAGNDPSKLAAYNQLHDIPIGRHTFRVLSVVWGIGLVIEASFRMVLAEALHTSTFLAVSPFITAVVIGSLFVFTVVYSKRAQEEAAALMVTAAEAPGAANAANAANSAKGAVEPKPAVEQAAGTGSAPEAGGTPTPID
ncbi:MAG TPA: VC0807 family protein [Acidimicrobiales bacterium]|nr:VC0807 family protein [Acidimicrobiales bacterium]